MKKFLRNQKGINLITLTITVLVILVLTNIILYNVSDNLNIQKLRNMQTDIENLRDKVSDYYMQYGDIPAYYIEKDDNQKQKVEYKNIGNINAISNAVDTGKYYVIDLSAIDNLTLNYGQDYKNIKNKNPDEININDYDDLYIINEDSHNIFYVRGVSYDKEKFYTDYTTENADKTSVELIDQSNLSENWSTTYNKTAIYKDCNEDIAYIPEGFQVSRNQKENNINDGLVIKNSSTGDKYVWIPVPKSVFKTTTSETDYGRIESDIKTYTDNYSDDNCLDIYYEGCGIESEAKYDELKHKMLNSIYKNKGFWISQYEIGTDTVRTNVSTNTNNAAMILQGKYPYNYVTVGEAQQLASKISLEDNNYTTSLMFGMQWDLVLKYIEVSKSKGKTEIINDSSEWANYNKSEFSITKGMYLSNGSWENVADSYLKRANISVLLSTGATDRNATLNIYDLAGNVEEWTLETSKIDSVSSIARGGTYEADSDKCTASNREIKSYSNSNYNIGFRVALY